MTPNRREGSRRPRGWRTGLVVCLFGVIALVIGSAACAAKPGGAARPGAHAKAEEGVRWQDLKPAQQLALKPLKREWSSLDTTRKRKWLRIASRYAKLSAPEQARLQARMTEWSDLTPQQRGQARLNFQEARELPREDRQARWEAYQALSPERKQELADRAAASRPGHRGHHSNPRPKRGDKHKHAQGDATPQPRHGTSRRPAAPTMVRADHGATTTPISRQPALRKNGGQPRLAATPELVNRATLLPKRVSRRPQGTATPGTPASGGAASHRP
jgi:hypothetical protein